MLVASVWHSTAASSDLGARGSSGDTDAGSLGRRCYCFLTLQPHFTFFRTLLRHIAAREKALWLAADNPALSHAVSTAASWSIRGSVDSPLPEGVPPAPAPKPEPQPELEPVEPEPELEVSAATAPGALQVGSSGGTSGADGRQAAHMRLHLARCRDSAIAAGWTMDAGRWTALDSNLSIHLATHYRSGQLPEDCAAEPEPEPELEPEPEPEPRLLSVPADDADSDAQLHGDSQSALMTRELERLQGCDVDLALASRGRSLTFALAPGHTIGLPSLPKLEGGAGTGEKPKEHACLGHRVCKM